MENINGCGCGCVNDQPVNSAIADNLDCGVVGKRRKRKSQKTIGICHIWIERQKV